jgi:hypothetical protein
MMSFGTSSVVIERREGQAYRQLTLSMKADIQNPALGAGPLKANLTKIITAERQI